MPNVELVAQVASGAAKGRRLRLVPGSGVTFLEADGGGGRVVVTVSAAAGGALTDGDKGDITVSGGGATWTIDTAAVTLAKMANMATDRLLGRDTAGAGVPEVITIGAALEWLSTTQGAVLYRGAAGWSALAVGTDGDVLTTHGAAADPTWETPTGGGVSRAQITTMIGYGGF